MPFNNSMYLVERVMANLYLNSHGTVYYSGPEMPACLRPKLFLCHAGSQNTKSAQLGQAEQVCDTLANSVGYSRNCKAVQTSH